MTKREKIKYEKDMARINALMIEAHDKIIELIGERNRWRQQAINLQKALSELQKEHMAVV